MPRLFPTQFHRLQAVIMNLKLFKDLNFLRIATLKTVLSLPLSFSLLVGHRVKSFLIVALTLPLQWNYFETRTLEHEISSFIRLKSTPDWRLISAHTRIMFYIAPSVLQTAMVSELNKYAHLRFRPSKKKIDMFHVPSPNLFLIL